MGGLSSSSPSLRSRTADGELARSWGRWTSVASPTLIADKALTLGGLAQAVLSGIAAHDSHRRSRAGHHRDARLPAPRSSRPPNQAGKRRPSCRWWPWVLLIPWAHHGDERGQRGMGGSVIRPARSSRALRRADALPGFMYAVEGVRPSDGDVRAWLSPGARKRRPARREESWSAAPPELSVGDATHSFVDRRWE